MRKQWMLFVFVLICIRFSSVLVNPYVKGREMQTSYGYSVGDTFTFRDSTIENLDSNQTHLYEESTHQILIHITAIDENVEGYTIRLTTEITNLSAGLDTLNHTLLMEGHTSVVAAPRVYFTHTLWSVHSTEFFVDVNNYQAKTQMSGTVQENSEQHLFCWNLSRYVTDTISTYDLNLDGHMDAYTSISGYSAQFNDQGVLLLREFITEFRFDNGARYHRLRRIILITNLPSIPTILFPETGIIVGLIILVTIFLTIISFNWYRRVPSSL